MYLELLRAYNDLSPKVDDDKELRAYKYQARNSIGRIIDKYQKQWASKWHTMRDMPVEDYYLVSGREEGDIDIAYFNKQRKWEGVDFPVMAWMELPMWFAWEDYPEEFEEE